MKREYGQQRRHEVAAGAWVVALAVAGVVVGGGAGCGAKGRLDSLHHALVKDDEGAIAKIMKDYPTCEETPPIALSARQASPRDGTCFTPIVGALGSKGGFNGLTPDQASDAAAAIVLLRDGRGDWLAHADVWLGSVRNGKGMGVDTLRLAIARKMAAAAPRVGRRIDEESDARAALAAIAGAIPGACPTYQLIGAGAESAKLAPEHSAEHASCVHRDLTRREGPGATYGAGTFRALEGALALWRETERALRQSLILMDPDAKGTFEPKLRTIEAATQAIATKKLTTATATLTAIGEAHAAAGVTPFKSSEPGDGGVDASDAGGEKRDAGAGAVTKRAAGAAPKK